MSNSNTCKEYEERLDAYLDGELSEEEREALEFHLSECSACSRQLKETSRLVGSLKSLTKEQPPREIDFSFMEEKPSSESCSFAGELLDAFHDNELNSQEITLVAEHLSTCSKCASVLAETSLLVQSLNTLPRMELPRDIVASIPTELMPPPGRDSQCRDDIKQSLDAYFDGELNKEERKILEAHLSQCGSCPTELEKTRQLSGLLNSLPRLQLSRDIAGTVDLPSTQKLLAVEESRKIVLFGAIRHSSRLKPYMLGAAAAALLLLGISLKLMNNESMATLSMKTGLQSELSSGSEFGREKPRDEQNRELSQFDLSKAGKSLGEPRSAIANRRRDSELSPETAIANQTVHPSVKSVDQEIIKQNEPKASEFASEIAAMPDVGNGAATDALGISTDEDGLYEIKI